MLNSPSSVRKGRMREVRASSFFFLNYENRVREVDKNRKSRAGKSEREYVELHSFPLLSVRIARKGIKRRQEFYFSVRTVRAFGGGESRVVQHLSFPSSCYRFLFKRKRRN